MKVCVVCPHFPDMSYPCGAADFAHGLTKQLSQKNAVTVVTANNHAISPEKMTVKNFAGPWGLRSTIKIGLWLRQQDFDVVDIQFELYMYGGHGAMLLLPFFLKKRTKKVLTLHSEALPPRGGKLWRLLQMKLFDEVIFYSAQFLGNMSKRFQASQEKFSLAPFPSNIALFPDSGLKKAIRQSAKGLRTDTLYLSYFGHISDHRGIEFLLEVLKKLKGEAVHLMFIGQFDPAKNLYHRDLISLIKAQDVEEMITFTGRLEEKEVSQMISLSDLGILPFSEGASFKNGSLAAYVSHNVPVLTTSSPLTETQILDCPGIIFFDMKDAGSLSQIILEIKNSSKIEGMKKGMAQLENLYSWKSYLEQRETIYHKQHQ